MVFLDPKQGDDHDDALPGAPGLHLDLDVRQCPECHRQTPPWQPACPDCGVATVAPDDLPPTGFLLPGLGADEEE